MSFETPKDINQNEEKESNPEMAEALREQKENMLRGMIASAASGEALLTILNAMKGTDEEDPSLWDKEFGTNRVIFLPHLKGFINEAESLRDDPDKLYSAYREYVSYSEPGREIAEKLMELYDINPYAAR